MGAGKYDRFITIQRANSTHNDYNEPELTWTTLERVPARAMPISDGERARAGEDFASNTMRFQIRYSSNVANVNPKDRLLYEGKTFEITGVKELGRREELELTAASRTDI